MTIVFVFCMNTEEPQTDPNAPAQTQDVVVNIDDPGIGEDTPEKPEAQVMCSINKHLCVFEVSRQMLKGFCSCRVFFHPP